MSGIMSGTTAATRSSSTDPTARLAAQKREFGEWGGVNASVEVSTTFTVHAVGVVVIDQANYIVMQPETLPAIFSGQLSPDNAGCYLYARSFSPSVRQLGITLAALEGTESAYICASGMAAISSALLALCNASDNIVSSNAVYGGTHALLTSFLPAKTNITTTFVDIRDLDAVRAAIVPGRTKVVYLESLSNPTLVVPDLPALASIAHDAGAQLVVDNTFAPCILSPARWGADVVVHSLTKYINGASDSLAGAICGSDAFIKSLLSLHMGPLMLLGPTIDPQTANTIALRIPHLALRMREHSERALYFATRLEAMGVRVVYPGLRSHPQHELLQRLSNDGGYGFGGVLTIDMGGLHRSYRLMERLQNTHQFGLMAVSLGYFETLMSVPGASTSSELTAEDKERAGITSGLVRLSIGITGTKEQRWAQLEEAVKHVLRGPLRPISPPGVNAILTVDESAAPLKRNRVDVA